MRKTLLRVGLLLVIGCASQPVTQKSVLPVFGTLVEITLIAPPAAGSGDLMSMVEEEFLKMHREWHPWQPGGELYRLNQALGSGRKQEVSGFLLPLIRRSRELYAASGGLFDPAVGKLVGAWGFHRDDPEHGLPPDRMAIRNLMVRAPGMADLVLQENTVFSENPSLQLDFGAVAKGYALDHVLNLLQSRGVDQALINAGGDLCVRGTKGKTPWRAGIRDPVGAGLLGYVELSGKECLMTSGGYERFRSVPGGVVSHIIDPRTGQPSDRLVSVSVIAEDGALADAAATALTVAGPAGWHEVAGNMGLKWALLVDDTGTLHMNPAMRDRLVLSQKYRESIMLSKPL